MSLDDLEGGADEPGVFRHDLEEAALLSYFARRYRRRHPRLPVRLRWDLWALVAALAAVGLIGSLGDWGLVACLGWGGAGFTLLCMVTRHAI